MIGDLIALLFLSRDLAHRAHLKATGPGSYAAHAALGSFYDEVIDLTDKLAEAYQGRKGIIDNIPLAEHDGEEDIVVVLEQHLKYLEDNRYEAIPKTDAPLQNIVDEVAGLYLSTLYKLKNLK